MFRKMEKFFCVNFQTAFFCLYVEMFIKGCGVISLQQLPKNVLHCAKYSLTPVLRNLPGSGGGGGGGSTTTCGGGGGGYSSTLPPTHMGTVRCEIFLKHLTILPEEMYANLQQVRLHTWNLL